MTSMTATPESPLPIDRPRSRRTLSGRIIGWLRANLFASIPSSIISLLLIFVLGKALAGGILAAYYGWRPVPAGPKHLEWVAWKESWGRSCRIAGIVLLVFSIINLLVKAS